MVERCVCVWGLESAELQPLDGIGGGSGRRLTLGVMEGRRYGTGSGGL